jgi:hypothetical protein
MIILLWATWALAMVVYLGLERADIYRRAHNASPIATITAQASTDSAAITRIDTADEKPPSAAAVVLVAAGFADSGKARCIRHGKAVSCRHMTRIHHHRHFARRWHAYPMHGYGYYGYSMGYDINHSNSKG